VRIVLRKNMKLQQWTGPAESVKDVNVQFGGLEPGRALLYCVSCLRDKVIPDGQKIREIPDRR